MWFQAFLLHLPPSSARSPGAGSIPQPETSVGLEALRGSGAVFTRSEQVNWSAGVPGGETGHLAVCRHEHLPAGDGGAGKGPAGPVRSSLQYGWDQLLADPCFFCKGALPAVSWAAAPCCPSP